MLTLDHFVLKPGSRAEVGVTWLTNTVLFGDNLLSECHSYDINRSHKFSWTNMCAMSFRITVCPTCYFSYLIIIPICCVKTWSLYYPYMLCENRVSSLFLYVVWKPCLFIIPICCVKTWPLHYSYMLCENRVSLLFLYVVWKPGLFIIPICCVKTWSRPREQTKQPASHHVRRRNSQTVYASIRM